MRIKGILKTSLGEKSYIITDRVKKYHRIKTEKFLLKIKDYPKVVYCTTIKEAKDYLNFAVAYFQSLSLGNSEDIPII